MKEQSEQAKTRQAQRLKRKIKSLIYNYGFRALFITIDFNDDIRANTTAEQRERIVKNYLNKMTALYIANRDYGKRTNREHYHALIVLDTLKNDDVKNATILNEWRTKSYKIFKQFYEDKGRIDIRPINKRDLINKDLEEITKIFTLHALKDSTQGARIIFSRNTPTDEKQRKRIKELLKAYKEDSENALKEIAKKQEQNKYNALDEIEEELADIYGGRYAPPRA